MKFKTKLKNVHDLKKDGYKFINKLHKLERKKNLDVYKINCDEGAFVIISIKKLAELFERVTHDVNQQKNIKSFILKTDVFLAHLDNIVINNKKINPRVLSSYLKSYTTFFNCIIKSKMKFNFSQDIDIYWVTKCVLAYYAAWGSNKRRGN